MRPRWDTMTRVRRVTLAVVTLVACDRTPKVGDPAPATATVAAAAPPRVLGPAELDVHHETVHVHVVLPNGASLERTRDQGFPIVSIDLGGVTVRLQYDSGIDQLGATVQRTPPTVYGLPVRNVQVLPDNVTAWYDTKQREHRVLGFVPGVKCAFETSLDGKDADLERAYDVCRALRPARFGALRQTSPAERAELGLRSFPEGAWLASGRYPRLHMGDVSLSLGACPDNLASLKTLEVNEVSVTVDEQPGALGPTWVRRSTEARGDDRIPGGVRVYVRHPGACCRAQFVPWIAAPSKERIDAVRSLCAPPG